MRSQSVTYEHRGVGRRVVAGLIAAIALLTAWIAAAPGQADASASASAKKAKVKASVRRGQLNVLGTAANDKITLRLKPGNKSRLQVDAGSNGRAEYTFKRSAFKRIVVHAGRGSDAITIDEKYGVFTAKEATSLFGDAGSDVVIGKGTSAAEKLEFSRAGSQLRFARNGSAFRARVERFDLRALGGADNVIVNHLAGTGLARLDADLGQDAAADVVDVKGSSAANELRVRDAVSISGIGAAVNLLRAQAANDKLNLDPGAGSDRVVVEGTSGNDTMNVAPAAVAPRIAISGGPAGLPIDVVNAETLAVESQAGNDTLAGAIGLAALTQLTLDGGAGNDSINGGDGADTLRGGTENDAIDGNRGDDTGLLGAGDDSFTWDPGDGSDKVEGEAGTDTMIFNGAGAAENFDFSANGNRLRFIRDVANITMDVDDTERVDLRALGGIDNTVVNDLSATDVREIALDLAADGAVDTTTINGSAGNDTIAIAPNATAVDVTGLAASVKIAGSEAANDVLNVNGLDGNDTISGAIGLAALIKVGIDGGAGNDTINGGDGAEQLTGGDGNDAIDGNRGDDTGLLGAGNDSFRWDPGDGSDVVEGQADTDTLLFNGAGAAENFDVSANGERVRFFRDVANITMDLNDTERIDTQALGGADNAVVNDLTGTDLTFVSFDLEGAIAGGAGDGAADSVTVNGTAGNDAITVAANGTAVDVTGLPAAVNIDHSEAANDKLTVNGLAGADTIIGGPGLAALIQLVENGGTEVDVLTGGDGNDRIVGQQQNDSMFGAAGDDTLVWNPGDGNDLVEGQSGNDTMEFNGSAGAEIFDASAVAGRLRFTRNVANIVMDVGTTEIVDLAALAGADTYTGGDLTGTGVNEVIVDLEATIGGGVGDAAADIVTVSGSGASEAIELTGAAGQANVVGLSPLTRVRTAEVPGDLLTVNALGGADTILAATLPSTAVRLTLDGGAGADLIRGGQGADTLLGGSEADDVDGNQGNDAAFLGTENDVFTWDPGDGSDTVEGQAGTDKMVFNGSGGAENFSYTANGGRLTFFRNLGNITMDVDDTELVDLRALGGADTVVVNDLTGTDVTETDIDLAGAIGGTTGDGAADAITINGTNGADNVAVAANGGVVDVTGVVPAVGISHSEAANDTLAINGLDGNDDVAVGGGVAGLIQTAIDLGAGE
jgi:Ca2+-binding RTX toxin-like protein